MKEEKTLSEIGGYTGLINVYYNNIKEEIKTIKADNEYQRDSHAFAHWFLFNIKGLNEQNIAEMITDDFDDWSIDAVNIDEDNDVIELYQFKMPSEEKNINSEIKQEEILKFLFGYKVCSSGKVQEKTNKNLANKIIEIAESEIFSYKLIYVSYTSGLGEHARITLESQLEEIEATGNQISWELYDKTRITNYVYSSKRKAKDCEIVLNQVATGLGYMATDNSKSYSLYVSLDEIARVCEDYGDIIFDENVRLFHGIKNNYNKGIMDTAQNDANNFHLYNNGIVILSDQINASDAMKKVKIKNPRVVNGCQSMNSLVEARKNKGKLEGFVQVKAIEITDPSVRQNISIYLNSQTEIKDSYLISNLPIVIQLEDSLKEKGFFLERQANEIINLKKNLSKKEAEELFGKGNSKVISLELAIQCYATFFEELGPVAKLNKAKLFNNKNNLEKIFKKLNAEKVLLSYNVYSYISYIITMFRRYRRNNAKKEILEFLEVNEEEINDYIFMNTADIFLLSAFSEVVQHEICPFDKIGKEVDGKIRVNNFEEWEHGIGENKYAYIRKAISFIKGTMDKEANGKPPATLTKNGAFHRSMILNIREAYSI